MFIEEGELHSVYRGMNPSFVHQVWAKRREQRRAEEKLERAKALVSKQDDAAAVTDKVTGEQFQAEFLRNITFLRLNWLFEQGCANPHSITGDRSYYRAADIIRIVVANSDISYTEMMSDSRFRYIVTVRQKAMAFVYVLCPHLSLPQIGALFGGRDHTTVLHAVRKYGVWRGNTPEQERAAA